MRSSRATRKTRRRGTLFNLAICHEREGRIVDAYRELDSLAERARGSGRADKAAGLEERLRALRPKLARIDLVHRSAPRSPVTVVTIDEVPLVNEQWSRPSYVAPGTHTLHFRYADGSEAKRTLGPLAAGSAAQVVMEEPAPSPSERAAASRPMTTGRKVAITTTAVAGVAFVAAGAVLGVRTLARRDRANDLCPGGACVSTSFQTWAYDDRHDAKIDATLSTAGLIVGGAAVAASLVLFIAGRARGDQVVGLVGDGQSWRLGGSF